MARELRACSVGVRSAPAGLGNPLGRDMPVALQAARHFAKTEQKQLCQFVSQVTTGEQDGLHVQRGFGSEEDRLTLSATPLLTLQTACCRSSATVRHCNLANSVPALTSLIGPAAAPLPRAVCPSVKEGDGTTTSAEEASFNLSNRRRWHCSAFLSLPHRRHATPLHRTRTLAPPRRRRPRPSP